MARGVNKVILIGNLGADPETRYTAAGAAVTNCTVATSESWKDKDGTQQERTEWHRCIAFNRLAEVMGEYLRKGSKVYIEGKLQTRKWQDREGVDRYTTEIVVGEMQMLDSRGAGEDAGQRAPATAPAQAPRSSAGTNIPAAARNVPRTNAPPAPSAEEPFFDDDIPF